jgi:hypothetical protein
MMEQIERDVREALAACADEVPARATGRLRAHDYRPRTRAMGPPVAAGALAAGVAVAAVLAVDLGTGTTEAFAGWTASPTHATDQQTTAAESACRQRLAAMPAPPSGAPAPPSPSTLAPVLTDTRGPFTFVIFASDHASASCISSPAFTSLSGTASTGSTTPPAGKVVLSSAEHTARAGQAYSFAEGHTGAGVTATTLILSDGTRVQASSANGWFVAWWPGASQVVGADVTTAQGTSTQHFDTAPAMPCPQGANVVCTGASGSGGRQSGSITMMGSGSGPSSGTTMMGSGG